MKPRIFIGSSFEGLSVAKRVKDFFQNDYDCFLWSDDIFKNNESFLETLVKSASLFDFGFMIFQQMMKLQLEIIILKHHGIIFYLNMVYF